MPRTSDKQRIATIWLTALSCLLLNGCDDAELTDAADRQPDRFQNDGAQRASRAPDDARAARLENPDSAAAAEGVRYVGGEACAGCHPAQAALWRASHHDLAMQVASEQSVLGDFSGAELQYAGTVSTFFKRGEEFWVRTDGPEGDLEEFKVTRTFGVEPLQQYLVELARGHIQPLGIAWDTRPAGEGGQRWFHLYPDERVDHDHPLHWTHTAQNWNAICAACHSTNLRKNYDVASDTFATTWSSIDVDCEACHGPGSAHVADPSADLALGATASDPWRFVEGRATAVRDAAAAYAEREIETCAQCHSRRSQLTEGFKPGGAFLDHFEPVLLTEGLYYSDGQIRDEVFVYGSFLQSRMYAAGVTCSDCHDPHSAELSRENNDVCTGCHAAAVFDDRRHHHHASDAAGSYCVDCHMPATTYMVVDPRRDHSFRIPRPDLSSQLGAPNACASCHDQGSDWAADAVRRWFPDGRSTEPHYGEAIHAGRRWDVGRDAALRELADDAAQPAIVRATALDLLGRELDDAALDAVERALNDGTPLIELAALRAVNAASGAERLKLAPRFLDHPLRALRIEAARVLVPVRAELGPARRRAFDVALREYLDVQQLQMDNAQGFYNAATVSMQLGRHADAEAQLEKAIARDPWFAPAYVNLADLYRQLNRDTDGEALLRDAAARLPDDASIAYALGLTLVRLGRQDEALEMISRAAALDPDEPLYAYARGLALSSAGDTDASRQALEAVNRRFPAYRPALLALATGSRDAGRLDDARRYAEQLLELAPTDRSARALLDELRARDPERNR